MNPTILVSGASGIIGYGILKSLRRSHPGVRLIGTTIHGWSAALTFSDVFEKAPPTSAGSYWVWLAEVIDRQQVNLIIPGIESDVTAWSAHRPEIGRTGAEAVLNNPDLIDLCADKWLFYERLKQHDSPYAIPTSLEIDEGGFKFPLLLKPRRGSASRGIMVIEDRAGLEGHRASIGPQLMIQPVIGRPEEEYTASAFFTQGGRLCAYMALQRKLSREGFTETAQTVELEGLETALQDLAAIFRPVGPTNFQFRLDGRQLKLLEINPRISSATSIRTSFGYNESAMSVDYFLYGRTPVQPAIKNGYAVRYIEDLIFHDSPDF